LTTTEGITCRIYRENDSEDGRIERVFWTYDWCLNEWKKNPEIWSLDCTTKVVCG
jgi:hypothetical protein